MKLSAESHKVIETFFREFLKDEKFILPPTYYHTGRVVGIFAKSFGFYAITFGRRIFLAPHTIRKDGDGKKVVSGWLIAHECCHVLQYEREGFFRFLLGYVIEYLQGLKAIGRLNINSHIKAYSDLKQEREAIIVENAYMDWRRRRLFGE
jgi:hypothetical protein